MLQKSFKKTKDKFVKVPLWWAEQAMQVTRSPKAMVCIWLLHLSWDQGTRTFRLPNERLKVRGVSRFAKSRALQELEAAGLIRVTRERGKSPEVTLLYL
jgi:hypothetical protein